MKKLLLLITGLLLLLSVDGQILRYSNYVAPIPSTILVNSIDVWGTGGATTIATNGGTLQMLKKTLPANAADTTATWSRINGTGTANISTGGLLTALTNGTVTARATANDGSAIYGEEVITISNQVVTAPSFVTSDGYTEGWFIADADNVTLDGSVITQWSDVSGNNNHMTNALGTDRPTWDGTNTLVSFDGVDDFLEKDFYPTVQTAPITVYMVVNQVSSTQNDKLLYFAYDAYSNVYQGSTNNSIVLYGGEFLVNSNATVGSWSILTVVLNGANSIIDWNGTAATGNAGASGLDRFRISGMESSESSNIQVKELIYRYTADDATERGAVFDYLNATWGLGL